MNTATSHGDHCQARQGAHKRDTRKPLVDHAVTRSARLTPIMPGSFATKIRDTKIPWSAFQIQDAVVIYLIAIQFWGSINSELIRNTLRGGGGADLFRLSFRLFAARKSEEALTEMIFS